MLKRLATLVLLPASALLLGGCVVFTVVPSGEQVDVVGKMRVTMTICASGEDGATDPPEDHPGCSGKGNSDSAAFAFPDQPGPVQLLLAYRVPVGTGAPESIAATPGPTPPATGTIAAHRSPSYEAALRAAVPPAAGSMWVGYLSDPYTFDDGADGVAAQSATVAADFSLPPTANGGPFVGTFNVRPVVGARQASSPSFPADRPVDCGADVYDIDLGTGTVCIDSPVPGTGFNQVGQDWPLATRDFGVVAGSATVSPGQTVTLPFGVRGAGALPAGLTASLSAATTLPGASVAPSQPSAPLANGSNTRVTVPVAVPRTAGPGVFDVTLTGRLDNGQTRVGTAKLTVRDRQKPVVSKLKVKPKRFRAATRRKPKRGTKVSLTLSEQASLKLTVERCAKRAGKRKRGRCVRWKALKGSQSKAGAKGANGFRFNGRWRGRALKAGAYRLVVTPTDTAGNRGAAARAGFAIRA